MKRNAISVLQKWHDNPRRKPFYLTGIKGVGKTYLALECAKSFFDSYFYVNLEMNTALARQLEEGSRDRAFTREGLRLLADYFEVPENLLYSTLLILDELYVCPQFASQLVSMAGMEYPAQTQGQFTDMENPFPYWLLVSSMECLSEQESVKTESYTLFPLQFDEFLTALGNKWYVEAIQAHYRSRKKIPDIVHQELLSTFDEYLWLGGMPDVLNEYFSLESSDNIRERQEMASLLLLRQIEKCAPETTAFKCRQLLSTLDDQLKKENQKFQFNLIRKGTTYQMYQEALDFLIRHHMAYRINELKKEQQFKLFFADFSFQAPQRGNELTTVERHIRLQNYFLQTLRQKETPCFFWESKSQASVEFVLPDSHSESSSPGVVYTPLELKSESRSKSKSIRSFQQQYFFRKCVKFSDSNFVENDEIIELPVYSVFCFENRD